MDQPSPTSPLKRELGLFFLEIPAYLAGVFLFLSAATALTLLGIAICTGYPASSRHLVKKIVGI